MMSMSTSRLSRPLASPSATHSCHLARSPLRSPLPTSSTAVRVSNVNQDSFDADVLKSTTPVLVDVWATWCGPCKLVAPLMDSLDKELNGAVKIVKVEHDANPEIIAEYKVYGLPALILFKDGKSIAKREGAISKKMIIDWLKENGVATA